MTPDETKGIDGGDAKDAVGAFVEAATQWSAATTPDPQVGAALALGWRVGEALSWAAAGTERRPAGVADLGLDDTARWAVLLGQIGRAQRELLGAKDSPAAPELASDCPPKTSADQVKTFRAGLLEALYIVDEPVGKAFRLGHGLQQFCDPAATQPGADQARASIPPLKELLIDLGTKLPPNSGHAVRNSLTLWEGQLPAVGTGGPEVASGLLRQGELWRPILVGELAAKDVLRLSDYVGTAEEVVRRLRELAVRTAGRMKLPLAIVALLILAGLVLLWRDGDTRGGITAGAGSLIAAFGLTWKGIGAFFGHAAAQGEKALWDAQVDWTIAYRATVSVTPPVVKPRGLARLTGRRGGDRRAQRRRQHLETWSDWRQKWPSLDEPT